MTETQALDMLWHNTFFIIVYMTSTIYVAWMCGDQNRMKTISSYQRRLLQVASILNLFMSLLFLFYMQRYTFITPIGFETCAAAFNIAYSFMVVLWINNKDELLLCKDRLPFIQMVSLTQVILMLSYLTSRWNVLYNL